MSLIFKILFQTGDINIFVLCGVFFSRYVQLKRQKKHRRWNLRQTLVEKLLKMKFCFFEFKVRTSSFAKERKGKWSIAFFTKMFLFYDDRIEVTCKNQSIFQVFVFPGLRPWPWPRPPICIYRPWPPICFTGSGPQFVFTSPGPQFVITGPGSQFVFNSSGLEFVYTDRGPKFWFSAPGPKFVFTGLASNLLFISSGQDFYCFYHSYLYYHYYYHHHHHHYCYSY